MNTPQQSLTTTYTITGMTCQSCVATITQKIMSLPDIISVQVNLEKKNIEIKAPRTIYLTEVKKSLADLPKYTVSDISPDISLSKKTWMETYKPLLLIFAFILLTSIAYQFCLSTFNIHTFMNHIMAGFFIGLSFFKLLDLKAFIQSFSSYDPLAQKYPPYGALYPFIELCLGLMFVAGIALPFANTLTIIILSLTTVGVYKRLKSKSLFQCACLGTTFNLPLSNLTLAENGVMILMAGYNLFYLS